MSAAGRRGVVGLALACLVPALTVAAAQGDSRAGAEWTPVLTPNLEQMEGAVRDALTTARGRLDTLLEDPQAAPADLLDALAQLGELYLVYGLNEAASSCWVNAHRLAPDDPRWPYFLGSIHQRADELQTAREYLRKAQRAAPEDRPTELRLAQVELALGELEAAESRFSGLLESPGFLAAAHYGLGRIAASRESFAQAAEHLEAALAEQPQASAARYQLGLAYRELGQMERAREYLSSWGRAQVEFPDPLFQDLGSGAVGAAVYVASATAARARGDLAGVVEAYRKAVEMDPSNLAVRRTLAARLLEAGDADAALAEYREILRSEPDDAVTLYNLGTALARMGDSDGAESALRRAVAAAPGHADSRVNLAALLEERGDLAGAEALYDEALEVDPYDLELKVRRAEVVLRGGRAREAQRSLEALREEDPAHARVRLALGDTLSAQREIGAARAAYEAGLERAEETEERLRARVSLARLANQAGAPQIAVSHLEAAVELQPSSKPLRLLLANTLARAGELVGAAEQYGHASRLDPSDGEARFGRALALMLAGQDAAALRTLEDGVSAQPDHLALRHLLARLLAASPDGAVRDGGRALALAQAVFDARQTLEHAETLAMAYAEAGDFEQALSWQRQIIERARLTGQESSLEPMQQRLELYLLGRPCRAPWLESG